MWSSTYSVSFVCVCSFTQENPKKLSYSYSDITLCFNFRSSFIPIWISVSRLSFPIYAMWNLILHKSSITFLTKMWESIALSEVLLSPWCFKCLDSDLGLDLTFPWLSGQCLICLFYCFSTKNSFQMWYTCVCVCVCVCVRVYFFNEMHVYITFLLWKIWMISLSGSPILHYWFWYKIICINAT